MRFCLSWIYLTILILLYFHVNFRLFRLTDGCSVYQAVLSLPLLTMDSTSEMMTTVTADVLNASSNSSSNMTSPTDDHHAWIKSTVKDCVFYCMGVIIPTGLLCNAFCLIVCGLSHGLRRTTTGHYLMALAVADSLFLVGDLIRWLNSSNSDGQYRWLTIRFSLYSHYTGTNSTILYYGLVAWRNGNALSPINEVNLRRARLVFGWVTACRQVNHLGM